MAAGTSSSSSSSGSRRSLKAATLVVASLLALVALSSPRTTLASSSVRQRAPQHIPIGDAQTFLSKRQVSGAEQVTIAALAPTDPFTAALEALQQPNIQGYLEGGDNNPNSWTPTTGDQQQLPWNADIPFQQSAATNGSEEGGWQYFPDTPGFILNRTFQISNQEGSGHGIQPFYITDNVQTPENIKRCIILWPGKPRDAWNYANLMLNARSVAFTHFPTEGADNSSVAILTPMFMATQDITAGGGRSTEFAFGGGAWQQGSTTRNPVLTQSLSSYEIIDAFTDMLFDQAQFPNLNQVVIAGHSLGGQAAMRYALLKKTKKYDYNMRYWVGNPGSWAWLSDARPYENANLSCAANTNDSYTTWPYGLSGNQSALTKYARSDVKANQTAVVYRYLERKVHYGLSLLDNGPGDTHCEAAWQGANHLDRGSQFMLQFQTLNYTNNAFPANHTLDLMQNVSHQDYPMYSWNSSLQHLFYDDFNTRYPDLTNTTNPGDGTTDTGVKAFATPLHEKVAIGLLAGTVGLVCLCFSGIIWMFRDNYDGSWEMDGVKDSVVNAVQVGFRSGGNSAAASSEAFGKMR